MPQILGSLNPLQNPLSWHQVIIGNQPCPGVCIVKAFKRRHEWDIKKGRGAYGATVTFIQRPPASGDIEFLLWTPQHFADWDTFMPLLRYDPTKKSPNAIDIFHPSLAAIDVTSVVVESITNPVHQGDNLYVITVEMLEYFPPPRKSAISTPQQSVGGEQFGSDVKRPGAAPPAAQDAYQQQIAALLQQATAP